MDLSAVVDIDLRQIKRYEAATSTATIVYACRIANVLDVAIDELREVGVYFLLSALCDAVMFTLAELGTYNHWVPQILGFPHFNGGTSVVALLNIRAIEKKLCSRYFVRVHKSYVVRE